MMDGYQADMAPLAMPEWVFTITWPWFGLSVLAVVVSTVLLARQLGRQQTLQTSRE